MKWFVLCLATVLLLTAHVLALSQGFAGTALPSSTGPIPGGLAPTSVTNVRNNGIFSLGNLECRSFLQAGFQRMSFSFNLPAVLPLSGASAGLDLEFQDANMWTGVFGLEAYLTRRLSVFFIAQGDVPRDIVIRTGEQPEATGVLWGAVPFEWTGSRLEWWQIEGGLSWRVSESLSLLAGLKRDRLSVGLNDPRDSAGNPVNFAVSYSLIPGFDFRDIHASLADFEIKLWIPYLGVTLHGPNYRAVGIWSPFASVSSRIPLRALNSYGLFISNFPIFAAEAAGEWNYGMFKPGTYLEGKFEYDVNVTDRVSLQLWCSGSVLNIKGKGSVNYQENIAIAVLGYPLPFPSSSDAAGADGQLTRTSLAAGLSGAIAW
jgi:hypothetical protein